MTVRFPLLFALLVALCMDGARGAAFAQDHFPDDKLEAVIRGILKKKQIEKEQIDPADLKTIFFLDARKQGIKDLSGLELCTSLAEVKLSDNEIESIAPLAGLKNIQSLYLSRNKIVDVAPLGELVKLQYLELEGNAIESLAGLDKLENMRSLFLSNNKIAELPPIGKLARLRSLYLNNNQIVDLSPLKELKWVSTLALSGNKVADLSPLASYTELRYTFLQGNPLPELGTLVEMAEKDVAAEQRFAPYWFLYVDEESLSETGKSQLARLKELGVRVNRK